MIETTARDSDMAAISRLLIDLRTLAKDVVLPDTALRVQYGRMVLEGIAPALSDEGVTDVNGAYWPGVVALEGIASAWNIPLAYLRRLHDRAPELFDSNVNWWLKRSEASHMLRLLVNDGTTIDHVDEALGINGTVRAVLSDRYRTIDNLDGALAVMSGLRKAGLDPDEVTIRGDVTERRMWLRVTSERISTSVLPLVRDYTDPWSGRKGRDLPLLFAGLEISNSEVGNGAFSIVPRVVLQVCTNGQTVTRDAVRKVHLGSRLEAGTVAWSDETQRLNLDLIASKTADAVASFMSRPYLDSTAATMMRDAGVKVADVPATIEHVSKRLGYTQAEQDAILNAFIDGGDRTSSGLMHAVTGVAQRVEDGDRAAELEGTALELMKLAASFQ